MGKLFSTKQVAEYLGVNEKMVYTMIAEKGLPASKATGKWLFPKHLVDQWIEAHTVNLSGAAGPVPHAEELLIIAGSNDPLLEQAIGVFNGTHEDSLAVFGNLGSLGGIRALKQDLCHVASSHLMQEDGKDYNFGILEKHMSPAPAVVNLCRRKQGLIVAAGNPKGINSTADLGRKGIRVTNRKLGTGTRQLFDMELKNAGIKGTGLEGYENEVQSHMDAALEVLHGRANAAPGIQPAAERLGLEFVPWRWERYDLLIRKERFFDKPVQRFLGMLGEDAFRRLAAGYKGYDVSASGKMVFAGQEKTDTNKTQTREEMK
ncbi:MAG: helix-turn-helix transcriptional regulator [Desulfobacteraceae bacterium]|nr:helix-turn-helix transcriptional regulator [Desulfobacteraceae bacterium]